MQRIGEADTNGGGRVMPEISRFFGIIIYMNWREHPPMHFHAVYGEYEALITLDGKVYAGKLPGRALSLAKKPLNPIAPLE